MSSKPHYCHIPGGVSLTDAWGTIISEKSPGSWRCGITFGRWPDHEHVVGKGVAKGEAYIDMLANSKDAIRYRKKYYRDVLQPKALLLRKRRILIEKRGLSGTFSFGGRDCRIVADGKRVSEGISKVKYQRRLRRAEKRDSMRRDRRGQI